MSSLLLVVCIVFMGVSDAAGSVYTRWGRTSCPGDSQLVYSGMVAGSNFNVKGGGSNYICLPNSPKWGNQNNKKDTYRAYLYGSEYQLSVNDVPFSNTNAKTLHNNDAPCAVCNTPRHRLATVMIPGTTTCYRGWHLEYQGYLMAERITHYRTEFICVDARPEKVAGGHANHNGALLYPVEVQCGSLKCPPYHAGRELACVVCSQ